MSKILENSMRNQKKEELVFQEFSKFHSHRKNLNTDGARLKILASVQKIIDIATPKQQKSIQDKLEMLSRWATIYHKSAY